MSRCRSLIQLFLARLREFYREPEAIFWVYGFPVLLAVGLGIAFSSREPEPPPVDVQQTSSYDQKLLDHLNHNGIHAELHTEQECEQRLRTGKTVLYIVPEPDRYRYVFDKLRPEGREARYQVDDIIQVWTARENKWKTEDYGESE